MPRSTQAIRNAQSNANANAAKGGTTHKATKVQAKAKGNAAKAKASTKAKAPASTSATLAAKGVKALLALRASTPRTDLKAHYNIRRALRANGYFISANRG